MENTLPFFAFVYAIISSVVLFFLFFSGINKKRWYNRYLHVALLALGLHVTYKLIGLLVGNAAWMELPLPIGLVYPTLLYLLARRFYRSDEKISERQKILFFLPYLVFTVLFGLAIYTSAPDSLQLLYLKAYYISLILSMLIYAVRITGLYQQYDGVYQALDLLVRQLTMMCFGLVVFGCLRYYEITNVDHDLGFEVQPLVYLFLLLGLGLVLRYRFAGRQDDMRNAQTVQQLSTQGGEGQPGDMSLPANEAARYATIVERELVVNRLFLNPSLSLDMLVQQTSIPRHHLSQLFNSYYEKTFYQFIAERRITYAMEQIVTLGHTVTLDSLSYECGFNSKTSFNRYFKVHTGMTPSEFRAYSLSEALPDFSIAAS